MADVQKLERALRNADAAASRGESGAAEDARALAKAYKAAKGRSNGFMPQLNQGIAESAGGIVDFLNPFDQPHNLNPFGDGTGSAVAGIESGMDAIGVNRATDAPEGLLQSFGRGAGEAAGAAPFAGSGAKALAGAGGLLGGIAGDASKALNTGMGFVSEALAGGGAQAAQGMASDAGAPEWVQQSAAIAGGAGVGGLPYLARKTPSAIGARKLSSAIKTAMMPYTNVGGKEVARQRVQELAGGPERASELAKEIGNTEIGLTPAQQTGDPNLIGLEQEVMRQSPKIRAGLDERAAAAQKTAEGQVMGLGGDPALAQSFFETRRADARANILGFVDRATDGALRPTAKNAEMINSQDVAEKIRVAASAADQQEKQLWEAVPKGVNVGTERAKQAADELIKNTPRAQQKNIPNIARTLLSPDGDGGFGEFETVAEMHGLYSELRRVARSAMAGTDQNRDMARISNNLADAILDDLGANAGQTDVGKALDIARAFSAEKHEIFSQGVVGRLLKRTLDGDEAINPALTLDRSVGRGGAAGAVGADDILNSTGSTAEASIEDYLKSKFSKSAFTPEGAYSAGGAQKFGRDNAELMQKFPYLQDYFKDAVRSQNKAATTAQRGGEALAAMENPAKSIGAAFTQAPAESAIDAVFKAKRPTVAAQQLAATARKDETGAALAGIKGAFSDYLIRNSIDANGLSGDAMRKILQKPELRATFTKVMSPSELRRMDIIAIELKKLRTGRKAAPDIGGLSPRSPNRIIEMAARIIAAKQGAKMGGGSSGASIQTANMASGRAKQILGNLQNDKAEQLLMDAVQDPELFRLLLSDPGRITLKPNQLNRLAPYFSGTAAAGLTEE